MERDFLPPKSGILYQLFSVYTVYVHRILPSPIHSPSMQQILVVFYVTGTGDLANNKAIGGFCSHGDYWGTLQNE